MNMPQKRYTPTSEAKKVFANLSSERKAYLKQFGLGFPDENAMIETFTCADCLVVGKCDFAFDAYNTDDDCLALK